MTAKLTMSKEVAERWQEGGREVAGEVAERRRGGGGEVAGR